MRMIGRLALAPALLIAAGAACFNDLTPPRGEQVGGTVYNMPLSLPSPIRMPAGTATSVSTRTVGGILTVDSIRVTVTGLKELAGTARYQWYVVNGLTGAAWPIRYAAVITRTDTTFNAGVVATTTTNTTRAATEFFEGAPFNTSVRFRILNLAAPDTIGLTGSYLVLTIQESTAPAFTATTPKMLWIRFRDQRGTAALNDDVVVSAGAPPAVFGTFRSEAPDLSRPWIAQGTGRGAFWDKERDTVMHFSGLAFGLPQPPVGYYYQPWVRDTRTGAAGRFGELRDPRADTSLFDADLRPVQGTLAELTSARFGTHESSLGCNYGACPLRRFQDFTNVQIVLEPKAGVTSYPNWTVALQGTIPNLLTNRRIGPGFVRAEVTRAGVGFPNATIAIFGAGTSNLISARTTDATGTVLFDQVPTGPVDVRAYVASPNTISPAVRQVTVVAGQTVDATFIVP